MFDISLLDHLGISLADVFLLFPVRAGVLLSIPEQRNVGCARVVPLFVHTTSFARNRLGTCVPCIVGGVVLLLVVFCTALVV